MRVKPTRRTRKPKSVPSAPGSQSSVCSPQKKLADPTSAAGPSAAATEATGTTAAAEVDAVTSKSTLPVLVFEPMPEPAKFREWQLTFKKTVVAVTIDPDATFEWLTEIEKFKSWEETTKTPFKRPAYPAGLSFRRLEPILSSGIQKIVKGELSRQIMAKEEEVNKKGTMLSGRQMAWLFYNHFRLRQEEGAMLEIKDLMNLHLKGDNLETFQNEWEITLSRMVSSQIPDDGIMEAIYRISSRRASRTK